MTRTDYRRRRLTEQPFTPLSVPNLVLWLAGDRLRGLNDTDVVTAWTDSSRERHDAAEEGTASRRPTYQSNLVSGRRSPGLRNDGVNDILEVADHADLRVDTAGDMTVIMAMSHLATGVNNMLFCKVNSGITNVNQAGAIGYDCTLVATDTIRWRIDDNVAQLNLATSARPSGFFVLSCMLDRSANAEVWISGTSEATADATSLGDLSTGTNDLSILARNTDFAQSAEVDMLDFLLFNAAISAKHHNQIGHYFQKRYDVSWTDIA